MAVEAAWKQGHVSPTVRPKVSRALGSGAEGEEGALASQALEGQHSSWPPSPLAPLQTALRLSCRGQGLPAFPQGLGRDVQELDLAHNSIVSLASRDTAGLAHLAHLDLSSNQLQAVSERALEPLVRLRSLRLAANRLWWNHSANGRAFLGLGSLRALDLSANQLDGDGAASYLGSLPALWRLDLSWNQVSWLSGALFQGVPHLRELRLRSNGLVAVEEGALAGLRGLRVLDLALNSLRCISGFRLAQVWLLNLSYNALESFAAGSEGGAAPQLRVLDLSHNQLAALPLLPRRTGLLALNLSHNADPLAPRPALLPPGGAGPSAEPPPGLGWGCGGQAGPQPPPADAGREPLQLLRAEGAGTAPGNPDRHCAGRGGRSLLLPRRAGERHGLDRPRAGLSPSPSPAQGLLGCPGGGTLVRPRPHLRHLLPAEEGEGARAAGSGPPQEGAPCAEQGGSWWAELG